MALLSLYDNLSPYEKGYEDAYMKRQPRYADYHFDGLGVGSDYRAYARGYQQGQEETFLSE